MTTRRAKRGSAETIFFKGFGGGLGEHTHDPNGSGYSIATNADCVLPDTNISVLSELHKASRRWYEGEIIEITTALGNKLRGTPNHPVLTNRGWIGLRFLQEGDYVISSSFPKRNLSTPSIVEPNPDYMDTGISEVFQLAAVTGTMQRKTGTSMDFHGDGQDGDVNVVVFPSELKRRFKPALKEPKRYCLFSLSNLREPPLVPLSLTENPRRLMALTHKPVSFCLGSDLNARQQQPMFNNSKVNAKFMGDSIDRRPFHVFLDNERHVNDYSWPWSSASVWGDPLSFQSSSNLRTSHMITMHKKASIQSAFIKRSNFLTRERNRFLPSFDQSMRMEQCSDLSFGDPESLRELNNGGSWSIGLDKVIQVTRTFYSGHVYNLETESGWYLANNIVSHNCRFGDVIPGPREVADMTGIPANYYVVDWIKHNDVNIVAATDGTNSQIFREETGAWASKATFNAAVVGPHCLLSFHDGTNSTLVCFLGASTAFQYSTNDGTGWTASNRTGNTKYGNMGIVRQNARTSADVLYVRNPNQIYTATSMVNGGAAADTGSTIGDGSAQTYFNSVVEDDTGVTIFGMRHAAWSMDSSGAIYRLCEDVPDPPADAGGTSDRRNFESFAVRGARIYYIVAGYELWEYYHGVWNKEAAPWHQAERNGGEIPRAHLPLNAVTVCGEWIVLAMGSKNTATNRVFTFSEGGTNLLQNTLVTTSELYAMAPRETEGGYVMVWHGSLLTCTDPLRFMWFDEDDSYLYLASGDAESINLSQKRCFFATSDPLTTAASSTVTLNNGTVTVETGLLSAEYPFDQVVADQVRLVARGLTASVTAAVRYRFVPQNDTSTAYTTLETFTNSQRALHGTHFPRRLSFSTGRLQFQLSGGGSGTNYAVLRSAELVLLPFEEARLAAGAW